MYPTPTPLPPVTAVPIAISAEDWGIWQYTDEAIQIWNRTGSGTVVIQWAVILIIVISFVGLMIYLVQNLMNERQ